MLRDIVVTNARWPESDAAIESKFVAMLTDLMPKTGIPISLERLKASLATAEMEQKSIEGLKSDPPKIVVVNEVSELLLFDGEPKMIPIKDTDFEYAGNSAFAVVRDKRNGTCFLSGGKLWYSASDPKGPWTSIMAPPADVAKLIPPDTSSAPAPAKIPKIVVATEPTELIATDGPPSWQPVGDGELLYITNTESIVVREVASGKVFVLISGRWFEAASFDGPWANVRPDQMPAAFKNIPPASALAEARVSVAGTPEAEDAVLDAQVPQTAAIERDKATLTVKYDGDPQGPRRSKARPSPMRCNSGDVAGAGVKWPQRRGGVTTSCDQAVWFVLRSGARCRGTVADSRVADRTRREIQNAAIGVCRRRQEPVVE